MTHGTGPSQRSASDTDLFLRWNHDQDEAAVAALWARHQGLAVTVARQVLRGLPDPQDEARDVADEGFLQALKTFDPARSNRPSGFRSWYLMIVRNASLDRLRRTRRLSRETDLDTLSGGGTAPALDAAVDVHRLLPQLERFVHERFLPSDWRLVLTWLEHATDGRRVPWATIAGEHDLKLDLQVRFPHGSTTFSASALGPVVRVLRCCLAVQVEVCGGAEASEAPDLARRRADRVAALVLEELRVKHLPSPDADGAPRVVVGPCDGTERAATITIRQGARRTPDALRMRLKRVLIPRMRAWLAELAPLRDAGGGRGAR
jgi:RNA polymerase sigma factor (sigma-70 family)